MMIEHMFVAGQVADELSLNPCCNGMMIELIYSVLNIKFKPCLNPCCNGMMIEPTKNEESVLYNRLNPCCNGMMIEQTYRVRIENYISVLILVVME